MRHATLIFKTVDMNNSNRERLNVAVQALDSLPSTSEDDSLFKAFSSMAISLKQDSLHWFQLNTVQMEELRNLSRIPSSIQNNALSVRLLIGDTLYHHNPDPSPSGNARLAAPSSSAATQVWESAHVKLMPNPNLGTFQVQILDRFQGNIQWEMVDLTGRLMLQGQSNQSMFTIQASQLSKGIYVLKMRAPNGSMYKAERVIIR